MRTNRMGTSDRASVCTIILGFAFVLTAQAAASPAEQATLTIRFADNATKYHVGEIIPIELAFSASAANTYEMDTRTYDRSGRLGEEQFIVKPEGRDPLYNHYAGGLYMGISGGGLSSGPKMLTSRPEVMVEELNEYVALDKPGHYTLSVRSGRVARSGEKRTIPGIFNEDTFELRSNTLEFDVIEADPEWQEAELKIALTTLKNPSSSRIPIAALIATGMPITTESVTAMKILRYLDSPGSVRELVRRIMQPDEPRKWDCQAGLTGSRFQKLVLQELESQLAKPDTIITSAYLQILGETRFLLAHPPQTKNASTNDFIERPKEFSASMDKLYEEVAKLVPTKQGAAQAETILTLLQHNPPIKVGIQDSDVAAAFSNLAPEQQYQLLDQNWSSVKGPAIIPVLEQLLDERDLDHYALRDIALRRLYELDSKIAKPIILSEIKRPHVDRNMSTVKAKTLSVLPDKTLPQFDQLLAGRIAHINSRTMALDAGLINRYATDAILPVVKDVYEGFPIESCDIADPLLSYFLRVDPEYGISKMRKETRLCLTQAFQTIKNMNHWADIEPAIIAQLNDAKAFTAMQAAEMLAKFGGPKAKAAMFERLRDFHEKWADREKDFAFRANMTRELSEAMSLQSRLMESLGRAGSWILTNEELNELEKLIIGSQRDMIKSWRWQSPIHIGSFPQFRDQDPIFTVGSSYNTQNLQDLCDKLTQFPKGTVFRFQTSNSDDRIAAAIRIIKDFAAAHGLTLENAN
jgi:hypothetical protein